MIPLEWYRNFVAVYRAGSVSDAARARGLSQPAVSQALTALEGAVGVPLFERTARGMRPTPRGDALYASVFDAMDRLDGVSRALRPEAWRTALRLGATPEYFHEFALERFAPLGLAIVVSHAPERDLLAGVENGTLDAAMTRLTPGRALGHRPLREQPFLLIAPLETKAPGDDLAASLNSLPWVSFTEERPITRRYFSQVLGARFAAVPRLVVPDLRAVVRAVELGVGASIVPEYAALRAIEGGRLQTLVRLELPPERWSLAYRPVDAEREEIRGIGAALR